MKKGILSIILFCFLTIFSQLQVKAVQFDVLVLPTDIFNVCDNYFCFPEPSEIVANDVINNLDKYNTINIVELSDIRDRLKNKPDLKSATQEMLKDFEQTEKIDFSVLKELSKEFQVKSIVLISSYAITDRSITRRDLWEVLEVSSAFKITYPFNLTTSVVLTDTVNSVIMWSNKYNKTVSDSNGYFLALNQAQAASHLEKIKQYYKNNVSQNISQNIHLRFFPKSIRTFEIKKDKNSNNAEFMPNALDHLAKPTIQKELDDAGYIEQSQDDFIFEF